MVPIKKIKPSFCPPNKKYRNRKFIPIKNKKNGRVKKRKKDIKNKLEDCIAVEDKKKPLTDEKLVNILKEKGYNIARRTIAKYREQLDIPVARLRKEL